MCCITSCDRPVKHGYQTCNMPDHHMLEKHGVEEHSTMFQLQKCLKWCQTTLINNSMSLNQQEMDLLTTLANNDDVEKLETGNVQLRAQFRHLRTHSEQLCVAMCGVVLG